MTNIIVTGSRGFLGQHLMAYLRELGYDPYGVPSSTYDLRTPYALEALFKHAGKPDVIFHLAASVGGISYNLNNPASIYFNNVMMNTQLIQRAALAGVSKFIFAGSACAYPNHNPIPTGEHCLWNGYPEESNASYGVSKRIALTQLQACRKQYGMDFAYPIFTNLYGPGDCFDDDRSHVIPALIKRFVHGVDKVVVWGDGSPTRDFLYVTDAVRALVACMGVECREPVNIASGENISIRRLVDIIQAACDRQALPVEWDSSKPNGQMERGYRIQKARGVLGWVPEVGIEEGVRQTVEWYMERIR